jgi:hypothetical protein
VGDALITVARTALIQSTDGRKANCCPAHSGRRHLPTSRAGTPGGRRATQPVAVSPKAVIRLRSEVVGDEEKSVGYPRPVVIVGDLPYQTEKMIGCLRRPR